MTEPVGERPVWRTGSLWAILGVLLVLGAVGVAAFVYGVLAVLAGALLGAPEAGAGLSVAVLAFLFMAGILYRVDRYRGAVGRRVELFE